MSVPYALDWPYYFLNSEEFGEILQLFKLCCRGYFRRRLLCEKLQQICRNTGNAFRIIIP
jgi:hypothetical protein